MIRNFYSRPCGRGDRSEGVFDVVCHAISTHAPAGGATKLVRAGAEAKRISTHAPAGGATPRCVRGGWDVFYFYSRPCGRGDLHDLTGYGFRNQFLLTPLREGRHTAVENTKAGCLYFYSRPCGRGDQSRRYRHHLPYHFYSRPCGRGDCVSLKP